MPTKPCVWVNWKMGGFAHFFIFFFFPLLWSMYKDLEWRTDWRKERLVSDEKAVLPFANNILKFCWDQTMINLWQDMCMFYVWQAVCCCKQVLDGSSWDCAFFFRGWRGGICWFSGVGWVQINLLPWLKHFCDMHLCICCFGATYLPFFFFFFFSRVGFFQINLLPWLKHLSMIYTSCKVTSMLIFLPPSVMMPSSPLSLSTSE